MTPLMAIDGLLMTADSSVLHYHQVAMFAFLYAVKSVEAIAIAFPLVIAACIPIRCLLLPKVTRTDATP